MIVDPIRHLTDILALGGIFVFAYAIAWCVNAISDASQARAAQDEVLRPIPVLANDNGRAEPRLAEETTRLAA
jgi:hypothetical protein